MFDGERLVELAVEAGLDAEAAAVLADPVGFADEVRADEREAPSSVRRRAVLRARPPYGVSGGQPAEVFPRRSSRPGRLGRRRL